MDRARLWRGVLVVTAVVAGLSVVALLARGWDAPPVVDLRVYREGVQRVLDGQPLYPPGSRWMVGSPLPFTYPPFGALLLSPTAALPVSSAVAAWWLLSFLSLWWLAHRSFADLLAPLGPLGRASASLVLAVGAVLVVDPVTRVFAYGQVGLLLAVMCLRDLDLGVRRSRGAGILVGLAAAVKLSPAAFVLTYLADRRGRAALTAAAVTLGCWAVGALALPSDTRDWLGLVLDADRVGPVPSSLNTSWHGLVLRLLGPGAPSTLVWLVLACATLALAAVRSGRALAERDALGAATVMGLAIVLAAPVSWSHHVVWAVPLVGLLVGRGRSWRRWLLAVGVLIVFSPPAMAWVDDDVRAPDLSGPADWLWVNTCILVMALAVLLLPVGQARARARAPLGRGADA